MLQFMQVEAHSLVTRANFLPQCSGEANGLPEHCHLNFSSYGQNAQTQGR
ncbi:MAG: hypothetical protein RL418_763 [Actinomycetota bacterium]|jgi:hypothetical protein